MPKPIRRALISVSDKRGVVDLARALARHGCEIISTGGTGRALAEAGVAFTEISAVTGRPEAFGGRMKTISYQIASALLFDRDRDAEEAAGLGIAPIDLVVCNLYPFEAVRDAGADHDTLIENIDIGGPTMIRAAAKNHRHVAVLVSPDQYPGVIDELRESDGGLGAATRQALMRAAFAHTARYDAAIAAAMDEGGGSLALGFEGGTELRYGENSHQGATLYRERGAKASLCDMEVLGGKALSFNNLVDLQAAVETARDLDGPGCAIIKHAGPCGVAAGGDQRVVFEAAWQGDPVSAFGSVIAFDTEVGAETAAFLELGAADKSRRKFVEIVVAPAFTEDALAELRQHKALRIIRLDPATLTPALDYRFLTGALLRQDADAGELWDALEVVTARDPGLADEALLRFGVVAVRQVKSNAIVVVWRRPDGLAQLLGAGGGQPNRVDSVRLATERARGTLARQGIEGDAALDEAMGRAVMVSDAFFPFPDNIELAAAAGVRTIVQPGGSIRDKAVIARCDELGVAMLTTGRRHFKH